jgi:two-component system cell cycle sensor histidine kinase PleC
MKLLTRLNLLVIVTLAPFAAFAAVAALLLVQQERETVARDAIGRARGAMSAVDTHLRSSVNALETLASFRALEKGDIATFHAESQRVLRTQPGWVNIGLSRTTDKLVLSNAVYAHGHPEPAPNVDEESFDAVVRNARPAVGSVAAGTVVRSPTARVRVPVAYGEEVRYVISAPLSLKYLSGLLEAQRVPEDSVIALVDREKRVIARLPPVPAGVSEADSLHDVGESPGEGWFQGRTREGRSAYTAYVTSQFSNWTLAISVPASTVEEGSRRTFLILSIGAVLALGIGLMLAWHTARRLSG